MSNRRNQTNKPLVLSSKQLEALDLIHELSEFWLSYETAGMNEPHGGGLPHHSPKRAVRLMQSFLSQHAWANDGTFTELTPSVQLMVTKGLAGFAFRGKKRKNGDHAMVHIRAVASPFTSDALEDLIKSTPSIESYKKAHLLSNDQDFLILESIGNIHDVPEEWIEKFAKSLLKRCYYSPRAVSYFSDLCEAYQEKCFDYMKQCYLSPRLVNGAIALTRNIWGVELVHHVDKGTSEYKIIKEPYFDYIERLSLNADAIEIKLSDLDHNLEDAAPHHRPRYLIAQEYLLSVKAGRIEAGSSIVDFIHNHANEEIKSIPDLKRLLMRESSRIHSDDKSSAYMKQQKHSQGRAQPKSDPNGRSAPQEKLTA